MTALKEIVEPQRAQQGITQEHLSKMIGCSTTTYRKWVHRYPTERGGIPSREDLEKIVQILGLEESKEKILEDLEI